MSSKETYLQGLQECEKMNKSGDYDLVQLQGYLDNEVAIVDGDYRWDNWVEGFQGGIEHFIRLNKLKL